MISKPKIYVWCNSCSPECPVSFLHSIMAMTEDGTYIAGHVCSSHGFIHHDMGFTGDWKHDHYDEHYPDGWELEFVESADVKSHKGVQKAYELNQQKGREAKEKDV